MDEELNQGDGIAPKHEGARRLAEAALLARRDGDTDRADELMAQAERTDPEAVAEILAEWGAGNADEGAQDDAEIAAMSRTIEPGSDAPSRAGISGSGSGADNER